MPCPEKRLDHGLALELAAQCVVLPSNHARCTTKEVAVVGAQPNGARLSCAAMLQRSQTYDSFKSRRRQLQPQVRLTRQGLARLGFPCPGDRQGYSRIRLLIHKTRAPLRTPPLSAGEGGDPGQSLFRSSNHTTKK